MCLMFKSKESLLKWIAKETGSEPVAVGTASYTEYYRSNNRFFGVRFNRRLRNYAVYEKKIKDGNYLTFYNGKHRTAVKINQTQKEITINEKWVKAYSVFFNVIVNNLVSFGIDKEDAKDYVQEGFIKISSCSAKNEEHFKNIWLRRCLYDHWEKYKQLNVANKIKVFPKHVVFPGTFEIRFAELLKTKSYIEIVNFLQRGYTITDISELTGQTFASVSCKRNRAIKELRKILENEI